MSPSLLVMAAEGSDKSRSRPHRVHSLVGEEDRHGVGQLQHGDQGRNGVSTDLAGTQRKHLTKTEASGRLSGGSETRAKN